MRKNWLVNVAGSQRGSNEKLLPAPPLWGRIAKRKCSSPTQSPDRRTW